MKKERLLTSALILIVLLMAAAAVNGQGINSYKGYIPFEFSVGEKVFAAGDYVVRFGDVTRSATVFTIADDEGREVLAKAVMRTGDTDRGTDCKLVFGKYGDDYVLHEMRAPYFAFEAPRGRTATWVYITKNSLEPEFVTIAMMR